MWNSFGISILLIITFYTQLSTTSVTNLTKTNNDSISEFGMQFRLPFIDMHIQSVSNLMIIKDGAGEQVFFLHENEFYCLMLEEDRKEMVLIAHLSSGVKESKVLGAEIISWKNIYLLIIALEDHLEAYQFRKNVIEERTKPSTNVTLQPQVMDPIQEMTLQGTYRKLLLCEPSKGNITLIVLVNFSKQYSQLITYEWSKTYFNPSEEKNISPVQDLHLIGTEIKYLVTSHKSKSQNKITVTVYKVSSSLKQVQILQLPSISVKLFTYQKINYLLSCPGGEKKCTSFRMSNEQYTLYRKRPASDYFFDLFTAGQHFLVGQREYEVFVFIDARMDCYGSFKTETSNITSILTHDNEKGNHYIILYYIQSNSSLLRFVEIDFKENVTADYDDIDEYGHALKQQQHAFEESIKALRKLLLTRKNALDKIKTIIRGNRKDVVFQKPVQIKSGNIGIVVLDDPKLRSPVQIMQEIKSLSNFTRKTRLSRELNEKTNKTLDMKVHQLRVKNLIYEGELIKGFNMSSDGKHLRISKPVTTQFLQTKEISTTTLEPTEKSRKFMTRSSTESKFFVRNLVVNKINDVSWEEFYGNLFLRSRDQSLTGRLVLQSTVEINNLKTKLLNELPTEKLFNLVDVQNITSDIIIFRFFVNDLSVDRLNGLDIANDIARNGVDNIVNSPVIAQEVTVSGKLILSENDKQARHIFETNILDFQQTYTGKVVINGSLTLNNIKMEDSNTRLIVDEAEVDPDIAKRFWMYSTPQTFNNSVSFANSIVSAPSLKTAFLNDNLVENYLITIHQNCSKTSLNLIFDSASISGNLIADEKLGTELRQINNSVVKISDRIKVSGEKFFTGSLVFEHASVEFLNDLPSDHLVASDEKFINFTGNKVLSSIEVTNTAVIMDNLTVQYLNQNPANNFLKSEHHFDTVILKSPLRAKNVIFDHFNGFSSHQLLNNTENVNGKIILKKGLHVEGNVEFKENIQVDTINNYVWNDYLKTLVRNGERSIVTGRKSFLEDLTINSDFQTPTINEVLVESLFQNVLLKSTDQVITGKFTFNKVEMNNVNVPFVNNFPTTDFIDTRSPELTFNCDLVVDSMIIHGSLFGNIEVDIGRMQKQVHEIINKPWKNIHVLGNASWPWGDDQQSLNLQYINKHAVRHFGEQVITGDVKFKKPLISIMRTKHVFPKDIDFDYIVNDCLFHNSSFEEVVRATKVFHKPIQLAEVTTQGHLGSAFVNDVDILEFNSSLYRLSQPSLIEGFLKFEVPPIFTHLTVKGLLNQMPIDQIFLAKDGQIWPPIILHDLHIERDLQLVDVNEMNLDFLLRNRIQKSGLAQEVFGHLTFEHLVLQKDIYIQSINGIQIDNLVQKNSSTLQEISGFKTIEGGLKLSGPSFVMKLNGEDLIQKYEDTIFLDKNVTLNELSVENAEFQGGLIDTSLNLKERNDAEGKNNFFQYSEALKDLEIKLQKTEDIIQKKQMTSPKRLLYFDYDFNTVIEWKITNESTQEQFIFDRKNNQYCDREQTIIKWSKHHNRIFLSKILTNVITAEDYGVLVTAENICENNNQRASSQITIAEPHFVKSFNIDKLVQSIDIFYASHIFILIHAIDLLTKNNEVRILKIDNNYKTIQDWQVITNGVDKVSKLFKFPFNTMLFVSTEVENYPSISIYSLNPNNQVFEYVQAIDGRFDIIEIAQVSSHIYHLFLSCVNCQKIIIFEHDTLISTTEGCVMYQFYQAINLKTSIDKLHLFTLYNEEIFLSVLPVQGADFYHFYKYQHIERWKHYTYGYFKSITDTYPLINNELSNNKENLLLICNPKCTLVKAIYQN